jgi:hypothetical protein
MRKICLYVENQTRILLQTNHSAATVGLPVYIYAYYNKVKQSHNTSVEAQGGEEV